MEVIRGWQQKWNEEAWTVPDDSHRAGHAITLGLACTPLPLRTPPFFHLCLFLFIIQHIDHHLTITLNNSDLNISQPIPQTAIMGKTNKYNDRDHAGLADGTAAATEHLPRYFAKSGHTDSDPKKIKKNGAGKGGWGLDGEEVQDEGFNLANARRRSNSSSYTAGLKDFKTKFEHVEQEPVFEEELHGAQEEDEDLPTARRVNTESSDGSIDEEDKAKTN